MEYFVLLRLQGVLAQLARALDWQSKGQGFDSPILHKKEQSNNRTTNFEVRSDFGVRCSIIRVFHSSTRINNIKYFTLISKFLVRMFEYSIRLPN